MHSNEQTKKSRHLLCTHIEGTNKYLTIDASVFCRPRTTSGRRPCWTRLRRAAPAEDVPQVGHVFSEVRARPVDVTAALTHVECVRLVEGAGVEAGRLYTHRGVAGGG